MQMQDLHKKFDKVILVILETNKIKLNSNPNLKTMTTSSFLLRFMRLLKI
jgi:hypothetical protein